MKIVLLTLSGDEGRAQEALRQRYPQAVIENIPRAALERDSLPARLGALRARRADVFAVSTERLAWQRGQNALLLFGALAGAGRSIMFDSHGAFREETRSRILLHTPLRFATESTLSLIAIARTRLRLKSLERDVKSSQASRISERIEPRATGTGPDIVFLRSTPGAGTQLGGAASHINGFINAAIKQGARLRLISNDRIAGLDETKVPLSIIEPEAVGTTRAVFELHNNLLFTRRAVREIERARPGFIYQRYSRFSWAGVEASLRTGRPLFLEYNGSEVWVGRYWDRINMLALLARVERLNLRRAARIFVVSEVERRNLLSAGIAPEKIVVNPNGVDVNTFHPNAGGEEVRHELGINEDETLVGFVGTFGPWHGGLVLAEAITRIPVDTRIRFLLVGSGSQREETERIIRDGRALNRVIFTGAVEHALVPALLDACDVLVSPHVPLEDGSEFFGSPTKLFEYMAMGKGIVASRLGQIAEVLADEETALLVEPNDAHALGEAIMRLADSSALRLRLGAAARNTAIARHTWERNAERVFDVYRQLLEERA